MWGGRGEGGGHAVFSFLSLSRPHLPLSAEMSWGSVGICGGRGGKGRAAPSSVELFGLVLGGEMVAVVGEGGG